METFRKLVHSVGVSIKAEDPADKEKEVEFCGSRCYGKTDRYTHDGYCEMEATIPCTGEEMVLPVRCLPGKSGMMTAQAPLILFSRKKNEDIDLTVKFYVNDGYEVPEIQS